MQDYITQLNTANPNVHYSLEGNTITGSWNEQAVASGALAQSQVHMDYAIIVTLNPDRTYTYTEKMSSSNTEANALGDELGASSPLGLRSEDNQPKNDGSINLFSSSSSTSSGKTFGMKSKGFTLVFGGKNGVDSYSYDFDADKIKQPLLQSLQASGYTEQKRSFLQKLFGK